MSKTIQSPFQNLKFIAMLNRILGLLSCKLVKGRLKSSRWGRYYCVLWVLIHCAYSSMFYYNIYIALSEKKAKLKILIVDVMRFTAFVVSLIPYNCVTIFQDHLIKFSDKLEMYDNKAKALGHERKDKHKFIWLFFILTTCDLTRRTYKAINDKVADGPIAIAKIMFEQVIPFIVATYCIFITGIFLDLIGQRFHHLNKIIIPHISQLPVTGLQGEITVYDVRYLHNVLIDSADQINKLYGIGSLFTSLSLLLEFIRNIYVLATDNIDKNEVVNLLDLVLRAVFLYAMYQFVTYEANRVEERVLKYGLSFQNEKCRMDKIEIMLYFYYRRFTFTAAGFFILDLTVLFSMFSTVTTFIVILV